MRQQQPVDTGPCFFARPQTILRLEDPTQAKTILVGSFTGGWNFGDLLQLRGAARWHRQRAPVQTLCPVQGLGAVSTIEQMDRLRLAFGLDDWLFFSPGRAGDTVRAAGMGLQRAPAQWAGPVTLHTYGGGFFNELWGAAALRRIETLFTQRQIAHYAISGQQVGAEFCRRLAEHCRRYQPDIVGCRDQASVDMLRRQGVDAHLSADDAFEELDAAATCAVAGDPPQTQQFGLYLNSTAYVTAETEAHHAAMRHLDEALEALARHAPSASPMLIRAYAEDRPHIRDTFTTIQQTRFAALFPQFTTLDLLDHFVRDDLSRAVTRFRQCDYIVSTSYHVTLFSKIVGVPVYLFAFNDYYRQKKQGLGDADLPLTAFLEADHASLVAQQNAYVVSQRQTRSAWLTLLEQTLAAPSGRGAQRFIASASREGDRQPHGLRLGDRLRALARRITQ